LTKLMVHFLRRRVLDAVAARDVSVESAPGGPNLRASISAPDV